MRLDAFLLADHSASAEGKLYLSGGGISRLNVPQVPFVIPMLSVLVRYVIDPPEDYGEHTLALRLETPSGVNLLPEDPVATMSISRNPALVEGEEEAVQMALNFGGVPILEEGVHVLTTLLDDEVTRRMTLPVVVVATQSVTPPRPNRAERRRQERERGRTPS